MEIADSIHGKKILYKKNFLDIQAYSRALDFEKVHSNLSNPALYSSHFVTQAIYSRRKLNPVKKTNLQ